MDKPEPIKSLLDKALKDLEIDERLKAYSIFLSWKEIVGESIASQSKPCFIRNKILFVDVSHSTWIQELQFHKAKILQKIVEFLGMPLIEDIRFRLGRINTSSLSHERTKKSYSLRSTRKNLKRIEEVLRNIEDEDMKRLLRNIFIKSTELQSSKKI